MYQEESKNSIHISPQTPLNYREEKKTALIKSLEK